jgi:glutathione S-transferase
MKLVDWLTGRSNRSNAQTSKGRKMMKLYYSPGACSLSPNIILREAGIPFELERVDNSTKKTETGADFAKVNPKGYVPTLRLDDGQVLTEGAAIVQYIADQRPETGLAPRGGTIERARVQEHLNFTASEIHKAFGPLFSPDTTDAGKQAAMANVGRKLDHMERVLSDGRAYLLGDHFSVADAYLFVVSTWTKPTGIGLTKWPHLAKFVERVAARPKVREAMKAEGLLA